MSKRHAHPPYTPSTYGPPIGAPPERTHRLPQTQCPTCGNPINTHTTLTPDGTLPPGQPIWALCAYCAGVAVLDPRTRTLREPTADELAACPPAHRDLLTRLRQQIRAQHAAWRQATTPLGA